MGNKILDSQWLRGIFETEAMRAIFSEQNLLQAWLDVEAALARAEAAEGIIPAEAAAEITRKAKAELVDHDAIARGVEHTVHPIVPMIRALTAICENGAGQYVHWGATTQDITDTGLVLLLKQAYPHLEDALQRVEAACLDLAKRHRDTLMAGRTHGQHALPITFGYKAAIWASEFRRHRQRLKEIKPRVLVGQLAGAVGTLAAIPEKGFAIQRRMMEDLGLGVADISWHVARDRIAEFASVLGMIAGTVEKIANEIINMQRTELAEVEEPFHTGKVGSSTMPHKRNPMYAEAICTLTTLVREDVGLAYEAMVQEHERDWIKAQLEWAFVPRICTYGHSMLELLHRVLAGLHVYPERMAANVDMLHGLILSEAVMIRLAEFIGRQVAHDVVYEASMAAFENKRPLLDLLAEDPRVSQHLDRDTLAAILDPNAYTGLSGAFVDRVLEQAQQPL